MVAVAKRMKPWAEKIVPGKQYPIEDAIGIVKQFATAKFDEAVDVSVNLGVDASKSDQQVRGSTVLPFASPCSRRARTPISRVKPAPTSSAWKTSPKK